MVNDKTLSRQERKRLMREWLKELGDDVVALRRVLRCTTAALDAALAGEAIRDEAAVASMDAALIARAEQTDRGYGRILRALRTQTGETSETVARACQIASTRMPEYERGIVCPTLTVALRLWRHFAAQVPGLRFEEVFGGELAAGEVASRVLRAREQASS